MQVPQDRTFRVQGDAGFSLFSLEMTPGLRCLYYTLDKPLHVCFSTSHSSFPLLTSHSSDLTFCFCISHSTVCLHQGASVKGHLHVAPYSSLLTLHVALCSCRSGGLHHFSLFSSQSSRDTRISPLSTFHSSPLTLCICLDHCAFAGAGGCAVSSKPATTNGSRMQPRAPTFSCQQWG